MIRGKNYNARLEALLAERLTEIQSAEESTTVVGGPVVERTSEIEAGRDHTRQHRNFSVDNEKLGTLLEIQNLGSAERFQLSTSQGNVLEIFEDGSMKWHTPGDTYSVVGGTRRSITLGDTFSKVDGNAMSEVDGLLLIRQGGTTLTVNQFSVAISSDVDVTITTTGDATVNSPSTTVTGGTLTVAGQSNINPSSGPFCALTNCLFTGAPHRGDIVSGT